MAVKSQLSEELKRHLEIVNYSDKINGRQTIEEKFKVTFQEQEPEEDEEVATIDDDPGTEDSGLDDMDMDLPGEDTMTGAPTPPTPGGNVPTTGVTTPEMNPPELAGPPDGGTPPPPPPPPTEGGEEGTDIEQIDVTDIVNNTEEIGDTVGKFATQLTDIEAKFADLSDKLSNMDMLFQKIDSIESEIGELKPPTPIEKMELRALDSFPYNQRLDKYFEDKKSQYKKLRGVDLEVEPQEKEYTLTQGDADEWDPTTIDKSFNPSYDENNPDAYTGGY